MFFSPLFAYLIVIAPPFALACVKRIASFIPHTSQNVSSINLNASHGEIARNKTKYTLDFPILLCPRNAPIAFDSARAPLTNRRRQSRAGVTDNDTDDDDDADYLARMRHKRIDGLPFFFIISIRWVPYGACHHSAACARVFVCFTASATASGNRRRPYVFYDSRMVPYRIECSASEASDASYIIQDKRFLQWNINIVPLPSTFGSTKSREAQEMLDFCFCFSSVLSKLLCSFNSSSEVWVRKENMK